MVRISKPPEERRQELIETAKQLFETQSYEKTTVSDIVKEVGVAQGLFYYYFSSKKEIFLAVIDQYLEEHLSQLAQPLRDSSVPPLERVHNLMQLLVGFMHKLKSLYPKNRSGMQYEMQAIMQNHVSEIIEPMLSDILRESDEKGILLAPFPDRLARFIISGFLGVDGMVEEPSPEEMMDFILFILDQFLHIPKDTWNTDK